MLIALASASYKLHLRRKMPDKCWISGLLFVEILSAVKFWFFADIVVAYWSEVSHHTGEYLTWSPVDLLSVFVVEGLHGNKTWKYKTKHCDTGRGIWWSELGLWSAVLVICPSFLYPCPCYLIPEYISYWSSSLWWLWAFQDPRYASVWCLDWIHRRHIQAPYRILDSNHVLLWHIRASDR